MFEAIKEFEDSHPLLKGRDIQGVADPAIWDAEIGVSVADVAAKYGIYFIPGDHKRLAGLMQCQYRLQFSKDGYPRMYVLDTCKDFIRTLPLLQYDEHKVEDVSTELEDHCYDEFRYFAMQHLISPMEAKPDKKPQSDPLDMFTQW